MSSTSMRRIAIFVSVGLIAAALTMRSAITAAQSSRFGPTDPKDAVLNQGPKPVTEVLINILDFGVDPRKAADLPRFWALEQGDELRIESRITDEVREGLRQRGIKVEDIGRYNFHTGSMQIVWRDDETGKLHGVTDARRLGFAAGH